MHETDDRANRFAVPGGRLRTLLHRSDGWFVLAAVALSSMLLFPRLADRFLWQDEAETALLARSVLVNGVPTAFDGRNLVSQEGQREFDADNHVWFWTPWLQHYLAACSFAALGEATTFSARLPFVLLGILTVVATHRLALALTDNRAVARMATILLMTSVPFLLHMRQCRYYAPTCLFTVLLLLMYVRLLQGRRWAAYGFVPVAFALFQSHYVTFGAVLAAVGLHFVVVARHGQRWRVITLVYLVTAMVVAPWAYLFMRHASAAVAFDPARTVGSLGFALYNVNRYMFPLALLLMAGGVMLRQRRGHSAGAGSGMRGVDVPICASVVCVAVLAVVMPLRFFRYFVVLFPLLAIVAAVIVERVWQWRRPVGAVLLVMLAGTDLLHRIGPGRRVWPKHNPAFPILTGDEKPADVAGRWAAFFPLAAYAYELTHDVDGPVEVIAAYLNERGSPDDTAIMTYSDLPLQFYTGMKIVGGLSGEDPRPHLNAEWIIVRAHWHTIGDARLAEYLSQNVDWNRYEPIELDQLDVPFENRPDPEYHKYRTATTGSPAVRIFRRVR